MLEIVFSFLELCVLGKLVVKVQLQSQVDDIITYLNLLVSLEVLQILSCFLIREHLHSLSKHIMFACSYINLSLFRIDLSSPWLELLLFDFDLVVETLCLVYTTVTHETCCSQQSRRKSYPSGCHECLQVSSPATKEASYALTLAVFFSIIYS